MILNTENRNVGKWHLSLLEIQPAAHGKSLFKNYLFILLLLMRNQSKPNKIKNENGLMR